MSIITMTLSRRSCLYILVVALLLTASTAFSMKHISKRTSLALHYTMDYNPYRGHYNQNHHHKIAAAQPLELSVDDMTRLQECYEECGLDATNNDDEIMSDDETSKVLPLILLDALLPNQRLFFSSSDPKFEQLLLYLHSTPSPAQVGILGFSDEDGSVLNTGVIATLCNINYGSKSGQPMIATSFKASNMLFEIFQEPAMDPTDSFYLAHVETMKLKDIGSDEYSTNNNHHYEMAEQLFASIPELIQEWKYWMLKSQWASQNTLERHYQWKEVAVSTDDLLQQTMSERSVWVASLLNPVGMRSLLDASGVPMNLVVSNEEDDVYAVTAIKRRAFTPTPHIRSKILECKNDTRRLAMAVNALKQSVEFLKQCDLRNGK